MKQLAPQDPTPADSSDRLINEVMYADWMRNIELRHSGPTSPWIVTARSRNDAHIVLLHDALGSHVLRRTAPNVFSGSMATGAPSPRHFTVEAISDSSLFDDAVPVSQHGWTFLYAVDP